MKKIIIQDGIKFERISNTNAYVKLDGKFRFGKRFFYYICNRGGCKRLVSNAGWADRSHCRKYHPEVFREQYS